MEKKEISFDLENEIERTFDDVSPLSLVPLVVVVVVVGFERFGLSSLSFDFGSSFLLPIDELVDVRDSFRSLDEIVKLI